MSDFSCSARLTNGRLSNGESSQRFQQKRVFGHSSGMSKVPWNEFVFPFVGLSSFADFFLFQELSRFHAISFALKKREKESFSKMRDRLKEAIFREEYVDGIMGAIWENSLVFAVRSLNESKDPRLKKASEKLECYSGRVLTTLISLSKSTLSKFDVLCHGDLWNNNILLRWVSPLNLLNLIPERLQKKVKTISSIIQKPFESPCPRQFKL